MGILFIIFSFHLFFSTPGFSQTAKTETLKVFFDCPDNCHFDYIRTELKWVDFVRDRTDANIHILITTQDIDGGGEKVFLNFIGLGNFKNVTDTITFLNDRNNTDDDERKLLLQYLKIGLTRYIARTSLAKNLDINYKMQDSAVLTKAEQTKKDPWNLWVFNIGIRGNINGSEAYKSSSVGGNFSANRTTEKRKSSFSAYYNNRDSKSTYGTEVIKVHSKSIDAHYGEVFSITNHWSWGSDVIYSNSLFNNLKNRFAFTPKIEYNIYPYSTSNSKLITFGYYAGPEYNAYYDTTIFFKTKEWLFKQTISAASAFTQPWGTINAGASYSNYFDDFKKNNLGLYTELDIKLLKGLSVSLFGFYSIVHDQLSLPKGNATRDDVLTQRRLIASSYNYYTSVGLQYRFGSKYNNVVNPRFSRGGSISFF
ncbi:MAG TPA: hypothetical protein VMY77_08300 [Chitinophagaceae bacterium]|nr:hypothetical protein [Chitinophagaceae bacterium]